MRTARLKMIGRDVKKDTHLDFTSSLICLTTLHFIVIFSLSPNSIVITRVRLGRLRISVYYEMKPVWICQEIATGVCIRNLDI